MTPKKLASQMILLVVIALFGTQILIFTIFIFETTEYDIVEENLYGTHYFEQMSSAVKVMESKGTSKNLYALNTYRVQFNIEDNHVFELSKMSNKDVLRTQNLRQEIGDYHPETYLRMLKPLDSPFFALMIYLKDQVLGVTQKDQLSDLGGIIMQIQVQLTDGRWLTMTVYDKTAFPSWISSTLAPTAIFTIMFVIFAVFVVKRITNPLAELAKKANKLGKGHVIEAIEPRGPEDVQNAIVAFNTMHKRLLNVNDHRARALAAISHDIRTPLTSMRLNAEYIGEFDVQKKILEKISEMEQICEATVTFALKDSWSEKNKKFDITSLIESLCCDLYEQDLDVSFEPKENIPYLGRPIALKRSFSNLIRNGVTYGNQVVVSIEKSLDSIEIHIVDQGSGIPEREHERLFEPFERLEESRNPNSGGLGLGMAIARSVIRSHGGEIELKNHPIKGLDVVVILPF